MSIVECVVGRGHCRVVAAGAATTGCTHAPTPAPLPPADRQLQRLKREFNDPSSRANSSRLASDLNDISSIMRRNVTEVLDRGEKLESA